MKVLGALFALLVVAACGTGNGGGATAGNVLDPKSLAYFQQTIGDRVFFDTDSSTLNPQARDTLTKQAAWIRENGSRYSITVEGHADERGTREYNLALGARRATAVRTFLAAQGLSPASINTVSYGKERPDSVGSDESAWSRNRRGVTVLQ